MPCNSGIYSITFTCTDWLSLFETSFDWKWCNSDKMLEQKLNYMHGNPCKDKWNLACSPVEYLHSSAKYYLTGEQGIYAVTYYKDLEAIDLHTLR